MTTSEFLIQGFMVRGKRFVNYLISVLLRRYGEHCTAFVDFPFVPVS